MSNYAWGLCVAGAVVLAVNSVWFIPLCACLWRTRKRKSIGHPAFFASRKFR